MATSSKTTKVITPAVPAVEETIINLALSQDEATFLKDILSHVGGSVYTTRRRYAADISGALYDAGISTTDQKDIFSDSGIHFRAPEAPKQYVIETYQKGATRWTRSLNRKTYGVFTDINLAKTLANAEAEAMVQPYRVVEEK